MYKISSRVLSVILFTLITFFTINIIDLIIVENKYNTSEGYIESLSDVTFVYNTKNSFSQFEKDLLDMDFVKTGENKYERAYTKNNCELIILDDGVIKFVITDACTAAISYEVIADFDKDGVHVAYLVNSVKNVSYLRKFGGDTKGIMVYNFETGKYTIQGNVEDYNLLSKYNSAYYDFLNELNAKAF